MDFLIKNNSTKKNLSKRDKAIDPKSSKFNIETSEDNKCPICLVIPIDDKSFANKCKHSFCKVCLIEWAKIRQECPLCRAPFTSILHSVKSKTDFKEVKIGDIIGKKYNNAHFIQFFNTPFLSNLVQASSFRNAFFLSSFNSPTRTPVDTTLSSSFNLRPGSIEHRRYIYTSEKYVLPCGTGITSRRREANPSFFRNNPSCMHRLLPFLDIELRALILDTNTRSIVLQIIQGSLTEVKINSIGFQRLISQYFITRTVHFIHEFYNFAISVFESVFSYYEEAIYMDKAQTRVVQIERNNFGPNEDVERTSNDGDIDDNSDDPFDLNDPYNYRSQRNIYNRMNNSNDLSSLYHIPYLRNSSFLNGNIENRRGQADEVSDDSDIEIVFEGSKSERESSDLQQSASSSRTPITVEAVEPKPSTSGLQNTKLNYSAPPTKTYQTDDSDISDDEYYKKSKDLNLNSYLESDDNDESVDVEIVGYVKPRHLRTPEIIELTDDDDDEYESETNKGIKRIKRELNDNEEETKSSEIKCRCKVKCKVACKKVS